MITLDPVFWTFIVGSLIPLLVGVVTKLNASSGVKAVVNALLSAIAGGVTHAMVSNGPVLAKELVIAIGTTWIASIVTYFGLWKPTHASGAVQESTAELGVG